VPSLLDGCRPMCRERERVLLAGPSDPMSSFKAPLSYFLFFFYFSLSVPALFDLYRRRIWPSSIARAKGQEINPARVTLLFLPLSLSLAVCSSFPLGVVLSLCGWMAGWLTGPERESDADGGKRSNPPPERNVAFSDVIY
jgi:hypothetical protein